jgi:hypothetical protein
MKSRAEDHCIRLWRGDPVPAPRRAGQGRRTLTAANVSARLRGAPRLEVPMATSVISLRHGRAAPTV